MASILKVDELQGITAAGDITITSEGGAATQSLQQGLNKAWFQFAGRGTPALNDSLNISSLSDVSTGNFDLSFTNNMANTTYAFSNGQAWDVAVTQSTTSGTDKDLIFSSFNNNSEFLSAISILRFPIDSKLSSSFPILFLELISTATYDTSSGIIEMLSRK